MLLYQSSETTTIALIFIVDLGLALAGKKMVVVVGGFTGKQVARAGVMIPAADFPAQSSPQRLRKLLFCQYPFSTFSPSSPGSKLLLKH